VSTLAVHCHLQLKSTGTSNYYVSGDRASARVASGGSGHAAGAGSIPRIDLRLSPGLAPRIKSTAWSRVVP